MKKIKIFLASSEDLNEEALELSDLVEHLNLILENQDIHIYLDRWEFLDNERGSEEQGDKRDCYESKLDQTDILIAIFGRELGSFTEKELNHAYDRLKKEGIKPEKINVYFKSLEGLKEDLRVFRDTFSENYGQIAGIFQDANILKNEFLLQFQVFQNRNFRNAFPIKITDSKVTLNGKDLSIDFSSLPYVSNVSRLNGMKAELENIELLLGYLSNEDKLYSEYALKKNKLLEEKEKLESKLWETAVKIEEFKEYPISNKLKRAIKLFENGEIERILEIIDNDEIKEEARENLRKIQEGNQQKEKGATLIIEGNHLLIEGIEGLKNNIRELQLTIQAEEINMSEGWGDRVLAHHENIINYTREIYGEKSEEYIEVLLETQKAYDLLGRYDEALSIIQEAIDNSNALYGCHNLSYSKCLDAWAWIMQKKGEYRVALEAQTEVLEIEIRETGRNSLESCGSMHKIGMLYSRLGEFNHALQYMNSANKNRNDNASDWKTKSIWLYDIAHIYRELGNYNKNLECLLSSLEILRCHIGGNDFRFGYLFDKIGITYDILGDYTRAIQYKKKAVSIFSRCFGEIHPSTISSYHNLAVSYGNNGDTEKEMKLLERVLKLGETRLGKEHPDVVTSMNNLSISYAENGLIEKALDLQHQSLSITCKNYGEDNIIISQEYHSLAYIYEKAGEYEKALEYNQKALRIKKIVLGEEHDSIALTYNNIGFNYDNLENPKLGLEYKLKAHRILKKIFGEHHPKTASSFQCVANGYELNGNFQKAIEYMCIALDTLKVTIGEIHPLTASCYNNLGTLYYNSTDFENALKCYQKALYCDMQLYGEKNNKDVAIQFSCIGHSYRELGLYINAIEAYKKCLKIRIQIFGNQHLKTLKIYENIAYCNMRAGNFEDAMKHMILYFEGVKEIFGFYHNETFSSVFHIGQLFEKMGDYEKSLENFQLALDISQNITAKDSKENIKALEKIAYGHGFIGDYESSYKYLLELLEIKKIVYTKDSREILELFGDMGSCARCLGNIELSLIYRKKELEWHLRNSDSKSEDMATAYNNVGAQYRDLGEYYKALEYIGMAYQISKESGRTEFQGVHLNRLGRVYALMGEKGAAKAKFEEVLTLLPEDHPEAQDTRVRLEELESAIKKGE